MKCAPVALGEMLAMDEGLNDDRLGIVTTQLQQASEKRASCDCVGGYEERHGERLLLQISLHFGILARTFPSSVPRTRKCSVSAMQVMASPCGPASKQRRTPACSSPSFTPGPVVAASECSTTRAPAADNTAAYRPLRQACKTCRAGVRGLE